MLNTAIKSSLVLVLIMLVQHADELWRTDISLSWSYLAMTAATGFVFTVLAYQYHRFHLIRNPAYQPEWIFSPLMYISIPLLLIVLTIWRG